MIFDAEANAIQTAFYGRLGYTYSQDIFLNPLGGNTKVGHSLFINQNLQMGKSFKMTNPTLSGTYNTFEIFFENPNHSENSPSRTIFRNYKKYAGSFVWQNLDDEGQPQDLMRLENGNLRVGQVFASKATIKINYWQDKVFDASYKLRTLAEVEKFINTHKHLPDVPAEKEILETGLSLGDMQAIQMQKIEELTLYIIEQNKQIQALQEENKALLKRLEALENKKP